MAPGSSPPGAAWRNSNQILTAKPPSLPAMPSMLSRISALARLGHGRRRSARLPFVAAPETRAGAAGRGGGVGSASYAGSADVLIGWSVHASGAVSWSIVAADRRPDRRARPVGLLHRPLPRPIDRRAAVPGIRGAAVRAPDRHQSLLHLERLPDGLPLR